ncbi:MAG: metalloregulator ArsR/SmtB family transcription factor [Alphaproteobacteria bacterium]|nr:metalloregulator ArsR/SmtB family transcription factor [Alphaproteobacteria bacterium]
MTDPDRIFKALSDPARLKILDFLRSPTSGCCVFEDRICACDLERVLGVSQATVSHHMKLLIDAGLVSGAKQGRWMMYRINAATFERVGAWVAQFGAQASAGRCSPGAASAS